MNDGILLVDKPTGPTSAEVVRRIKQRHRLASVGHLGTLDPLASGVLPLCVNRGTRIAQFLGAERKSYCGTIRLGAATDTLDVTGRVVAEAPVPSIDDDLLLGVAVSLSGDREQKPPMYSAVRSGGRRLYQLARAGAIVERAARPVVIESFRLTCSRTSSREIEFSVTCSKGTYIRVLAEEVARACGTVGALAELRRTEFGRFTLAECVGLEDLLDSADLPCILAPRDALGAFQEIPVDARTAFAIAAGQQEALRSLAPGAPCSGFACLIEPGGELLAVVEGTPAGWALRRVVFPEACDLYRPGPGC